MSAVVQMAAGAAPIFAATKTANSQEESMNKDQIKGRIAQAKGKAKRAVGKAVGDKDLEREGKIQNVAGIVQAGYGDLKDSN